MASNKPKFLVLLSTVIIFILTVVFEVLKTKVFLIEDNVFYHYSTVIFISICIFVIMTLNKRTIARYYQELNQELRNAQIAAAAANQELQAANQELQAAEDELRSTNDELEQQRQDLQLLLQTIPEGIIKTDAKGKVLFCNKLILEQTGLSQEDVLKKDIKNVVSVDDRPAFAQKFEKVFMQGAIKEMSFRNCQGTQVLADIIVMKDKQGQVIGALSAIREFSKTGKIIEALDNSRQELRQKIEEMQLLHRTTIDREKRIIDLKAQVETLKQELAKNKGAQTV